MTRRSLQHAPTFFASLFFIALSFSLIIAVTATIPAHHLQKRDAILRRQGSNSSSSQSLTPSAGSTSTTVSKSAASSAAASPSSSAPPPPPPPPTSSSAPRSVVTSTSSSTSSRSSSTLSSQTHTAIFTPAAAPPTTTIDVPTLTVTADAQPTDDTPTDEPTDTPAAAAAAGRSFWANKAAVGATFTVVTIIGIAAFFAAATYTMRRRKRNLLDQEEFLDKYPDTPSQQGHGVGIDNVDQHDVIRPAAPDAYPDRQIHFGGDKPSFSPESYATQQGYASDAYPQQQYASTQQQFTSAQQQPAPNQQQYASNQPQYTQYAQQEQFAQQDPGFEYPPGTAYSSDDQYPYDNEAAYGGATPTRQGASLVQPAYRQTGGRGSYQPSIDSFYGAPAAR